MTGVGTDYMRHHKERGVQLVKEKKVVDAFRRFNKALKMLVAIEPIDPEVIYEEQVKEMIDLRVCCIFLKLYMKIDVIYLLK